MEGIRMKLSAVFATWASVVLLGQTFTAAAAELKVIAAAPLTPIVNELGAQFERSSSHKLVTRFVSGPIVKQEIDRGDPFDLALSITPVIDQLIKENKIVADTRVDVAYAGVGVGVRAGAAKPDIASVEAFKRALLSAKSVAHSAVGASGEHFKQMLARLSIAEEMKSKLRPMPADKIAQAVPSGEAEMIVVTASVAMAPGTDFVGLIPAELQFYNAFAGGVGTAAKEPEAAKALLKILTAPQAAAVMRTKGMEPRTPR